MTSFRVSTRWGSNERNVDAQRMREVLAELDAYDPEHPDVSLTHESEWSLSAFGSGLLVWENLEHGEPRHMRAVPREKVLQLWQLLADGKVQEIDREPWKPGYGQQAEP